MVYTVCLVRWGLVTRLYAPPGVMCVRTRLSPSSPPAVDDFPSGSAYTSIPPSLYVLKLCAIHKLLLWEVSRPSLGCIASFSSTTPLCRLRYTAVFATFPKPPSPAAGAAPVITEGMGGDMAIDRGSETGLLKGRQTSSGPYDRAFQTMAAALRRWAFLRASLLKRLRSRSVSRSKIFWLITWFFAPFASFDYFALPLPPF